MSYSSDAPLPDPSPASPEDDPADWIVRVARTQDRRYFILLFEKFAPKVKAYLMRLGLPDMDAEEVAQETLLVVWRKSAQFNPDRASAAAWIFTIARNLRVDHYRRHRTYSLAFGGVDEVPTTPEQALGVVQGEHQVRRAMAQLPAEQDLVLKMAFFEDRPHSEIATVLGIPLGTVKSRIRLASAHLRLALRTLV